MEFVLICLSLFSSVSTLTHFPQNVSFIYHVDIKAQSQSSSTLSTSYPLPTSFKKNSEDKHLWSYVAKTKQKGPLRCFHCLLATLQNKEQGQRRGDKRPYIGRTNSSSGSGSQQLKILTSPKLISHNWWAVFEDEGNNVRNWRNYMFMCVSLIM